MRHPKIVLACWAVARAERRHGAATYVRRREDEATVPDPWLVHHDDGLTVEPHEVPVDEGATSVPVVVYRPATPGPHPMHVLLHGGGFCYGSSSSVDLVAREYASAGLVVVSVDYRLAPEHPWPVPVEDSYSALRWAASHAETLGAVAGRVSIGGVSAGASIAAVVALMARDRGGPALVCQVLDIPITDLTMRTGSTLARFGRRLLLTSRHLDECYDHYVRDRRDRRHPYVSPLLAPDLTGLPPAIITTCEFDPLRDEGEAYGRRLRTAAVPVELVRARGHVHSSTFTDLPSAVRHRARTTAMLTAAHGIATTG